MHATIVIPARYESTRFPGKILADATGKPLIQHVYEQASRARTADRVVVATDDDRIRAAVERFGGEVIMTRRDHPNGTSRIAEAVQSLSSACIVNVQGDEPEIDPDLIDLGVETLAAHDDCPVATIACAFAPGEDPSNPNVVKVVLDRRGRAMYFSRLPIPFPRDAPHRADGPHGAAPLKHLGLYVYRREFLATYVSLAPSPLEETEHLEQLRVLEHGHRIAVGIGTSHHHGIDTPEQYEAFVRRQKGLARIMHEADRPAGDPVT